MIRKFKIVEENIRKGIRDWKSAKVELGIRIMDCTRRNRSVQAAFLSLFVVCLFNAEYAFPILGSYYILDILCRKAGFLWVFLACSMLSIFFLKFAVFIFCTWVIIEIVTVAPTFFRRK